VRAASATLRFVAWTLLGVLAALGVGFSALTGFASSRWGRPLVAAKLIGFADDEVAGRLSLGGLELLPGGSIAIRDFRAYDPEGHLVVQVDRVLLSADLTRLRSRVIGVEVELEGATVLVDEDEDGRLSLARAFEPTHPSPPRARRTPAPWRDPLGGWSLRLRRLTVKNASLWWQDAKGRTRVEVQDVEATTRALVGPGRSRAELKLRAEAVAPVAGPLALDLRATLDRDRLAVPLLGAALGGTSISGLAEADLAKRVGRAALTRALLDRAQARSVVKSAPAGADLAFDAYAEADGKVVTVALRVEPKESSAGGAAAAVAARLDGGRALGFDAVTRALDPSSLVAAAPAGSVSLSAHGGFAGEGWATARGNLVLSLQRSTLRGGELGPASADVSLDQGGWSARKVSLAAPGLQVEGQGSWRQGGAATGRFLAEVSDLARAAENASRLLAADLPRMAGRAELEAELSGTTAAPALAVRINAPSLSVDGVTASGVEAKVDAAGPLRQGTLRLFAGVQRLGSGAEVVAQDLALEGEVRPEGSGSAATLGAHALVPSLGREPVSLSAAATLPADRASLRLGELSFSWPGTRYVLEAPAVVTFAGPRVDRLSLVAGPRRIAVSGGFGPQRTLDARLEVVKLDLAQLPAGVLPPALKIAGELDVDAAATGPVARPVVEGKVAIAGGGLRTERGIALEGAARWDGGERRISGRAAIKRTKGGEVEVAAELPVPLRGRSAEPVSASVHVAAFPLTTILDLAGAEAPVRGLVDADVALAGSWGSPTLRVKAGVAEGGVLDLEGVGVRVVAEVATTTTATADVRIAGEPAAHIEGSAPLSLSVLLGEPRRIGQRLREAQVAGRVTFPGLDVAAVAGRLGVPEGLRGRLTGEVKVSGRAAAPRGTAALLVDEAAWDGYAGIRAQIEGEAGDERLEGHVTASLGGQELGQVAVSLGLPVEAVSRGALRAAALRVDATVPGVDLEKAAAANRAALAGRVQAKLHAEGTLGRPSVTVEASGRAVRISGRPVGDIQLTAQAGGERASAEVKLSPPAGGTLTATATITAPISIDLDGEALRKAPAEVQVKANAVDLGFVPAFFPDTVRSASGRLDADVSASGPLAELVPRGTVRLTGGRLSLLDYGDWTDIVLDGGITAQAIELRRFEARRGGGTLTAQAALRGMDGPRAVLDGRLDANKLNLTRAGTSLGILTLGVKASGTYEDRRLDVRLDLPQGLVRLADKLPRDLQPLERRADIVVGPNPKPRPAKAGPAGSAAGKPFKLAVRLVAPGKLNVERDVPRIRLELKADVTYEREGGADYMAGTVEVVRGTVEPLSDRRFEVKRGRVIFTGGPPAAAQLDVEAVYDNPAAEVTVNVTGPLTKPDISLKSQPPLDDAQIAMLIATGQMELKAGGGGAAAAGQSELGQNAAQKLGFAVFNTFIRNQLPFSTGDVSLDANSARVSGYIPGTAIYVGYTRRFDANKTLGENENEVRIEYAITPHWTLEGRWGTVAGGASLIWSRDY
jgi:translocation and assembly module TamB